MITIRGLNGESPESTKLAGNLKAAHPKQLSKRSILVKMLRGTNSYCKDYEIRADTIDLTRSLMISRLEPMPSNSYRIAVLYTFIVNCGRSGSCTN